MSEHEQHFRTRPDVRFRTIADEGVIVRQEAGEAIVVNEVGARILELLRDGLATSQVIDRLKEEYEVKEAELGEHVTHYLTELERAGVIEPIQS